MLYNKKCKNCSAPFETKNNRKIYCSNNCKSNYCKRVLIANKYTSVCQACGNDFSTYYDGATFCSKRCMYTVNKFENRHKIKACDECGIEFEMTAHNHRYCSKECAYRHYYDKEWKKDYLTCEHCGKAFSRNKSSSNPEHIFCSNSCWSSFRSKSSKESRVCKYSGCNKTFIVNKSDGKKFCSMECVSSYNKTFTGEKGSGYNHEIPDSDRILECEYCGNEYRVYPGKIDTSKFCSSRCSRFGSSRTMTSPHKKISKFLRNNRIWNRNEYGVMRYSLDIFLGKGRAIEIMGGYWHGDIRDYPKPINSIQKRADKKDKRKKMLMEKEGITILYMWEKDIEESPRVCEELILLFLEKKNNLKNYHSMNYEIKNNELRIKKDLLFPRFEKQ